MLCAHCGSQIPGTSRFCTRCGTRVIEDAHARNSEADAKTQLSDETMRRGGNGDPLIGRAFEDKYRIESRLGTGGMGTVYSATRLLIGDSVAIKVLHPELVADSQAVERFRREAQAAARLKHSNAVAIYDFGTSRDGKVYIIMEMVEGESLRNIIQRRAPLDQSLAAEIISQVCAALDEAHRHDIVHRDIKPDNIVVTETTRGLRVKVLDFGIAKLLDLSTTTGVLTQTGVAVGTPYYMSPEQCMGEELDGRSDIYSIGIVLYEMLSGVVPFNSPTPTAVIVQQVTQPPPPLHAINVDIWPTVEVAVLHAMEKGREDRPQTAGAFAEELTAAVKGVTTQGQAVHTSSTSAPPTTKSTEAAPGSAPTLRVATPSAPASVPSFSSTAVPTIGLRIEKKSFFLRLVPLLVGAFLLLAIVAVAAILWLRPDGSGTLTNERGDENPTISNQTGKETPGTTNINTTPPEGMAYVPGGEFLMGSDTGDHDARPEHRVTVKPFFIDLYEITCDEYEKFIEATGRPAPPGWRNGHHPRGAARLPVTGVDWEDANAYCEWSGKRLPTEEEWEFAARGNDGRRYPWGNEWRRGAANAHTSAHGHLAVVGGHGAGPSPFGALDMVGNAWEWTASDLTAYPGGQLPAQTGGDMKVIRGGCWTSDIDQATTTVRKGQPARGGSDYSKIGFRCAKDPEVRSDSR